MPIHIYVIPSHSTSWLHTSGRAGLVAQPCPRCVTYTYVGFTLHSCGLLAWEKGGRKSDSYCYVYVHGHM